jgi:hypothetical protein
VADDKFDEPPHTPPYFELVAVHCPMDYQRDILLHFVHDKGFDGEFIAYLNEYFPATEDGRRERRVQKP